jgi:leader peptidase (prepilin peptidase)/N-methyltransferase
VCASPAVPAAEKQAIEEYKNHDVPAYGTPDQWLAYPHARREVLIELLFLGWPVLGALLGNALLPIWRLPSAPVYGPYAHALLVFLGVAAGYLVGGGMVWGTRILGTLAFGKEAMGLGDVHLMAAIGAVLGWRAAAVAFFLAPFGGIIGTVLLLGLRRVGRRQGRVVPYGPYLALAAVLTLAFQDRILAFLGLPHP